MERIITKNPNKENDLQTRIYKWVVDLINLIKSLQRNITTDVIVKQIVRSSSSVGANYIESQAASSRKDFINFFHHALKSANESKFWLCLIRDTCNSDKVITEKLLKEIIEISNILGASIKTAKLHEQAK